MLRKEKQAGKIFFERWKELLSLLFLYSSQPFEL